MQIYIPNTYQDWLDTKPSEGKIMLIAFLTKLHAIYDMKTFFELYNEDLDTINHTEIKGRTQQVVKELKELGLINQVKGADLRTTIRLSNDLIGGFNRSTILKNTCEWTLTLNGSLIWSYLMGRMANVDEDVEITNIEKIRLYSETLKSFKYAKKEKISTTHILPSIYAHAFTKSTGQRFETKIHMSKEEYAKAYYQKRRLEILARKKDQYTEKKSGDNV